MDIAAFIAHFAGLEKEAGAGDWLRQNAAAAWGKAKGVGGQALQYARQAGTAVKGFGQRSAGNLGRWGRLGLLGLGTGVGLNYAFADAQNRAAEQAYRNQQAMSWQ